MEEKVIMPLPFKHPDKAYLEMMDYIAKASEAVSKLCLLDVPRNINININQSMDAPQFVRKIAVKTKIDWLAINREMSDGSY